MFCYLDTLPPAPGRRRGRETMGELNVGISRAVVSLHFLTAGGIVVSKLAEPRTPHSSSRITKKLTKKSVALCKLSLISDSRSTSLLPEVHYPSALHVVQLGAELVPLSMETFPPNLPTAPFPAGWGSIQFLRLQRVGFQNVFTQPECQVVQQLPFCLTHTWPWASRYPRLCTDCALLAPVPEGGTVLPKKETVCYFVQMCLMGYKCLNVRKKKG